MILCGFFTPAAVAADKLTICYGAASSALVPLTKALNYYAAEGLDVEVLPLAQRPALPNYLDFIYFDGLQAVKPKAVTILH